MGHFTRDEPGDLINTLLCDELLSEILSRLHSTQDRKSATLVCKRWLSLEGRIKTKLGLCVPDPSTILSLCSSIHALFHRYSHLVSLAVVSEGDQHDSQALDLILSAMASSCPLLRELRFLAGPVTTSGLEPLARACNCLVSLELVALATQHLPVLNEFRSLSELSLTGCLSGDSSDLAGVPDGDLPLDKLCVEGIGARNSGLGWLWRSCHKLRRLEFFGCQGIGDSDIASLAWCLPNLQELRLRRCRCIATQVLLMVAEVCHGLKVLIFMDGGDMNGLHRIVRSCQSLETLELRLPLDLFNEDLAIIAQNCLSLKILRLYSCWMGTGNGFKLLGTQMKSSLEELVLIRCRAIVQDTGTLAYLGQDLKSLRRLDVSENDHLADREITGLLHSSGDRLIHLRLRRCRKVTDATLEFIGQKCRALSNLVITSCDGISPAGVAMVLAGCPSLKKLWVEKEKVTSDACRLAKVKGILLPGVEPNPSDY
ncbi:hypothetical protein SELMODRAFT_447499 [Selaginella moellendorffii]|uniref:COI1 F-box domain-containing protein n=1 Tax=Selaginella moellendorffii TaxID=88036 RepID=D8SZZ0_SELML|nr:F-box/LRR-repeat protein 4 [Selaginella moellendorffii]EFJ09989.1 hypothetical protein SELMODRAFT_447499 [Selaginella moellendorffii]|eukprot:XP_024518451.1 F-box/LRR-repeat protein 4 [Selaginella moellendorffii]